MFDLAIAVGILRATEQLRADCRGQVFFCHHTQLINGHEVAYRILPDEEKGFLFYD